MYVRACDVRHTPLADHAIVPAAGMYRQIYSMRHHESRICSVSTIHRTPHPCIIIIKVSANGSKPLWSL